MTSPMVRICKISGRSSMRTGSFDGTLMHPIKLGVGVIVSGDSEFIKDDTRVITTTDVHSIEYSESTATIHTKSGSVYKIEVLNGDPIKDYIEL